MAASGTRAFRGTLILIVLLFIISDAALGGITDVSRNGTSANCAPTLGGMLSEGSTA